MIYIDSRVGSRDLIDFVPLNDLSELTTLKSGDCSFLGKSQDGDVSIGIEIKTIGEFCSSARTGRLQFQVKNMYEEYYKSWLLYYGIYRKQPKGNGVLVFRERDNRWIPLQIDRWKIPYSYLQSVTVRVSELGIHTFHLATKQDVADWIYQIYRCWQKPPERQRFMKTFRQEDWSLVSGRGKGCIGRGESNDVMKVARVAAGLPGINFTLGVRAAKKFGTIAKMFDRSTGVQDWLEIEGIGKTKASKIVSLVKTHNALPEKKDA